MKKTLNALLYSLLLLIGLYGDRMPQWWHPVVMVVAVCVALFFLNLYRCFFRTAAHF